MLCEVCTDIVLSLDGSETNKEIRTYQNIYELRSIASTCAFCNIILEDVSQLEEPDVAVYCKTKWGMDFFHLLLDRSQISVTYCDAKCEQNVHVLCHLNARDTPGYPGGPTSYTWRSDLGGLYVHLGSPFAPTISGRPLTALATKEEMLSQVVSLYNDCRFHHGKCASGRSSRFMPNRLLDVNPSTGCKKVQLFVVPEGFYSPYSTLSYCWGKAQTIRLTKDTLSRFCNEGVLLCNLPTTIKDACEICASVGIRYLWVDSLCILQDVEEDWVQQASVMDAIYNSSELTISAAAGANCDYGIFNKRSWASLSCAEITIENAAKSRGTGFVRGRLESHGFEEPAQLRGWTMQECLLSRRLMKFGTAQMSWECASSHWNESGTVFNAIPRIDGCLPRPTLTSPPKSRDGKSRQLQGKDSALAEVWQDIVQSFCYRSLTFARDKLPAVSGLARWLAPHFSKSTGEDYVAGLWQSHFPGNLLWYYYLPSSVDRNYSQRPEDYRAPSWSWASLDCKYLKWSSTTTPRYFAKVLHCSITLRGNDRFGEVLDGYLDIEAPVKQGWLVPSRTHHEHFEFWDENWRAELTDRRPTLENGSLGRAWLDVITSEEPCDGSLSEAAERSRVCDCLQVTEETAILIEPMGQPAQGGTKRYPVRRRLGVVIFKRERAIAWWEDASMDTIHFM